MISAVRLAQLARVMTGKFAFRKRLPPEFGSASITVTSRSDIRLLLPGFEQSASDLLQVASAYIQPGNCVWDIGSNLGIFAFSAAWKSGEHGKICSLEADSYYVELQHKTARKLPPGYGTVVPLCAAVADKIGVFELAIPKRGHSRSHLDIIAGSNSGETEARKQVVSVTADFLLQHWPKPDFVKIDVEGAEILFLQGATALLKTTRPVFYIEVSESNQSAATDVFTSFNYKLFELLPDNKEVALGKCRFNTVAKPEEQCHF